MPEFKARIGREVPKQGETRVVFSIRTADGSRLEVNGTYPEQRVSAALAALYGDDRAVALEGESDEQ